MWSGSWGSRFNKVVLKRRLYSNKVILKERVKRLKYYITWTVLSKLNLRWSYLACKRWLFEYKAETVSYLFSASTPFPNPNTVA